MRVVNHTPPQEYVVVVTLSKDEAAAIITARRSLRKETLRNDLDDYTADVVNGLPMIIGSLIEDERDERTVDFDSRR